MWMAVFTTPEGGDVRCESAWGGQGIGTNAELMMYS